MADTLNLTPNETLTVVSESPDVLEVEATYAPGGSAPPKHLHPAQAEHFEVLSGSVMTRVGGEERKLEVGETLDIPVGTVHQMWNPGSEPARVRWQTRPAGRTLDWFRSIDALHRTGRVGRNGMPGPLAFAVLLNEFRDVFRLDGSGPVLRVAFALLAPLGRLRGYRAESRPAPAARAD
jgi:mannose-6-phosphate isomerase-like protein (cupin superfamily)